MYITKDWDQRLVVLHELSLYVVHSKDEFLTCNQKQAILLSLLSPLRSHFFFYHKKWEFEKAAMVVVFVFVPRKATQDCPLSMKVQASGAMILAKGNPQRFRRH